MPMMEETRYMLYGVPKKLLVSGLKPKEVIYIMPKRDGTGPPSGAKGPRDGSGKGKGSAPGKGTGPLTGGKKGVVKKGSK